MSFAKTKIFDNFMYNCVTNYFWVDYIFNKMISLVRQHRHSIMYTIRSLIIGKCSLHHQTHSTMN